MMNGINGSNCCSGQMQGMQKRQGQGERFSKLDSDGNGGIDQAELQTMADKISEITGQQMNVAELSEANDANNDGLLDKNEMQSMMMELRDTMGVGGQRGGGASSQQLLAAYQANPEMDLTSMIMDMLNKSDEDQEEYNPVNLKA